MKLVGPLPPSSDSRYATRLTHSPTDRLGAIQRDRAIAATLGREFTYELITPSPGRMRRLLQQLSPV